MIHRVWNDTRIPALGLGTWELRGEACQRAVEQALALGYRHLDTAQGYDNEESVGAGIAASGLSRDQIFLTTKVRPSNFRRAELLASSEASLAKLGVESVDLLLLHWPNADVPLEETLAALHEARARGLARHVGVSNFNPSMLRQAVAAGPTLTNQIEYHPFLAQTRMLALAQEFDLLITAYSPVARGKVMHDATLQRIADRYRKSPAQVALRWLLQQPRVIAIPKAGSAQHLAANLDLFDFTLDESEMAAVHALARAERLVANPGLNWEG
jgi:diketogulonate reductase-like aldo/keto reductase